LATSLIYLLARHLGKLRFDLQPRDWGLVAARCASEIGATYCFLAALMIMPIANITAVLQALPLTVTLGAAVFLGEEVGWRRMAAIVLGFCGVLLIVRPGPDGFSEGALYALLAVAFVTARDLTTRRMSSAVPSLTVTLLASISVTVFALVCSLGIEWQPVNLSQVMLLAGAAVFILGGYSLSVMVMRVGEISFVSPFRYTGLIWAILLGWLVFGDWPDGLTLLGAAIVVGTGLFTVIRERRQAQAAQKPV
jgi:drug/metabolite transporter (DMT)-like permease